MERYHIYKLGIAIIFYAVYCRRPMLVNGLEVDDVIGTVNNKSSTIEEFPNEDYYVYYQGVQGKPGVDFPVHSRIPRTGFSCKDVESGYYADLETDCQVFHICNEGTKVSFLCPNGTIFQQSDLICDWWFKVNCTNSPNLYEESAEQLRESHIRRKASRRVLNRGDVVFKESMIDRKMDVGFSYDNQAGRKFSNTKGASRPNKFHESDESQITQETASFYKSNYNNIDNNRKNPYPNHRETYSDIQQPKNYYNNFPATSSVSPQTYASTNKNALNNGQPFVVSTPKLGIYTTERSTFKYSPTVPATARTKTTTTPPATPYQPPASTLYQHKSTAYQQTFSNQFRSTPAPTTYKQDKVTYGTRIGKSQKATTVPKPYNNLETFTNPPSVSNGKSTLPRKQKSKSSFTIGLNSVQGSVAFKAQPEQTKNSNSPITTEPPKTTRFLTTTQKPATTKSSKNVIKLNLSSDGGAKAFKTKSRAYDDTKTIKLNLSSEIGPLKLSIDTPATNRPGHFVTKGNTFRPAEFVTSSFNSGSITGSKNTYIPTTKSPIFTTYPTSPFTEYHSNTFGFVKPTGIPKPKPFELPSSTTQSPYTTDPIEYFNPSVFPTYQISSASPFTNVPPTLPISYTTAAPEYTVPPTYPTIYASAQSFTTKIPQNVHNMIDTLKEIANVRMGKEEDFDSSRPGLIVPPSVGPQTLHTLAVYFANALDNLVPANNETETQTENVNNDDTVINSLLSKDTLHKYRELFMEEDKDDEDEAEKTEDDDNDLDRQHSNNAVQSPRVRQLAKVFTQALSSYLDDPDTFRKVLQEIRPTEPPVVPTLPTETPTEEDELLNFSDADIKPENPRLPTPAPANPTWGYILAFNKSDFKHNHLDNSLGDVENLQSADSQSFVPGFNDLSSNRVNKALRDESTHGYDSKGLPNNHWTSSPDATKLWQSTLYVNPISINQNFDHTESPDASSSKEGGEDFDDDVTIPPTKSEPFDDTSADLSEFATESIIDYELHSLPQLDLNSTQVHGILIDFMNSTKHEDGNRLQRILAKLNTTEDEFLNKMKEIEKNPLTRRLILLLVSECNNKTFDSKASAVRDIINLAQDESLQHSSSNIDTITANDPKPTLPPNGLTKLVDPSLKSEDQDSRALQLLNSLYSIASKYGK